MLYFEYRQAGACLVVGTSTLAGAVLMSLGGAPVKSCDQDDGPAERPARKPAELRDGSHLAYLMDRAPAGPLADRLRKSARETAEELRNWVRNDHAERQSRAGVSGTASLALAIAVSCVVAGCGGASTDWYTAGKA